jgi:hypothetical protein
MIQHTINTHMEGPTMEDVRKSLARAKEQDRLDRMNSSQINAEIKKKNVATSVKDLKELTAKVQN